MNSSKLIFLAFLSIFLIYLPGCGDNHKEEASPFTGDYIITKASLTETLVLNTNEMGAIELAKDTDITPIIQKALLGSVECAHDSSLIELREDLSLYLSCASSGTELDGGTWEEQSETVILLKMNSTAIPGSATGLGLSVADLTFVDNILSGESSIPLPRDMLADIVASMSAGLATLDLENTSLAVPLSFTIKLGKQ